MGLPPELAGVLEIDRPVDHGRELRILAGGIELLLDEADVNSVEREPIEEMDRVADVSRQAGSVIDQSSIERSVFAP